VRDAGPVAVGPKVISVGLTRMALPAPPRPEYMKLEADGCGSLMWKLTILN
jgi:hypothetical protein